MEHDSVSKGDFLVASPLLHIWTLGNHATYMTFQFIRLADTFIGSDLKLSVALKLQYSGGPWEEGPCVEAVRLKRSAWDQVKRCTEKVGT